MRNEEERCEGARDGIQVKIYEEMTTNKRKTKEIPLIIMACGSCKREAIKGRGTLKCSNCTRLVHFECTRLPPYMIFTLTSSKKQYICEECASPSEAFLRSILDGSIVGTNSDATPVVSAAYTETDLTICSKIEEIYSYIDKYDLPST